jgi:hypothetical protein
MPSYIKQVVEAGAKTLSVADYKIPVFTISAGKIAAASGVVSPKKETMIDKTTDEKMPEAQEETSLPTPTEVGGGEPELEFATEPAEPAESAEKAEPEINVPEVEESPVEATPVVPVKPEDVDLSQFSSKEDAEDAEEAAEPEVKAESVKAAAKPTKVDNTPSPVPTKPVIKNDRGTNSMVRMIFIGLASFFVTVGIGLGIGLGLLTFTKPSEETDPTAMMVETTPTPTPEATPTPAPAIDRTAHKIKVVNATTKAGYASTVAADLEEAGFEDVAAGNALGDYESGNYVLMAQEDQALVDLLSEDAGLSLEYASGYEIEDAAGAYTIIVVLAEN